MVTHGAIAVTLELYAARRGGSTLQWAVVEHGSSQSMQMDGDDVPLLLSMMQLLTTQVAPSQG